MAGAIRVREGAHGESYEVAGDFGLSSPLGSDLGLEHAAHIYDLS